MIELEMTTLERELWQHL